MQKTKRHVDCAVCGRKLTGMQTKTCSVKCRRKYVQQQYDKKGMDIIIAALKKLKSNYVSSRTIRRQANNMSYAWFKRLFNRIIKDKIVDSLPTERWTLYKLNEDVLWNIESGN